ncbi:MAG: hypothetical protein ABL921_20480 [Pirellula sp.]
MALKHSAKRKVEFLKTTAIGGVFFLLPLVIIGTFLAKFAQYSIAAAKAIDGVIPLKAIGGYPILLLVGSVLVVGACFAAGLIAKRSIAQRFTETVEKQIQIAFPRYAIIKDRLSGNIGGDQFRSELKSALVLGYDGAYRFGLIVEEKVPGWTTVYFPGSPDPWAGQVAIVSNDKLRPTEIDFILAMTTLEKLGRELQSVTHFEKLVAKQA